MRDEAEIPTRILLKYDVAGKIEDAAHPGVPGCSKPSGGYHHLNLPRV
jgi:hypothetical protein